ncbi:Hypothetical protein B591_06985 [Streptomyces sp. GBA 94-10 4N24]|nr:Hypothetical protein B591_06985 [Streptomyces sp. GBA 94-10 4N24]ESQ05494.1 Hypothetical protein B590_07080 [Streptomyces sp. PVA_94-07]UZN58403.1 Hypothetical protein B591N_06985 [Streptomyces sp. GBA 94-10 4N24]
MLVGSDGYPVALCTPVLGQVPTVRLLTGGAGTAIRWPP